MNADIINENESPDNGFDRLIKVDFDGLSWNDLKSRFGRLALQFNDKPYEKNGAEINFKFLETAYQQLDALLKNLLDEKQTVDAREQLQNLLGKFPNVPGLAIRDAVAAAAREKLANTDYPETIDAVLVKLAAFDKN